MRKRARAVEWTGLENLRRGNPSVSSNLTASARISAAEAHKVPAVLFGFDSAGLTVYIRPGQSRTIPPKPADNHGIARGITEIDTMALTARQVESAKPKEKPYKLGDAGGLYLYVAPTGLKSWRANYQQG